MGVPLTGIDIRVARWGFLSPVLTLELGGGGSSHRY